MKLQLYDHPDLFELADQLAIDPNAALGLVSRIYRWVGDTCPTGRLPEGAPRALAASVFWQGPPDVLVSALVASRWFARLDSGALVVHDWPNRCDSYVHKKVRRLRTTFWDGSSVIDQCAVTDRSLTVTEPDSDRPDPSRSEPSRSESSRVEPIRAEPPRSEPSGNGPVVPTPTALPVYPPDQASADECSQELGSRLSEEETLRPIDGPPPGNFLSIAPLSEEKLADALRRLEATANNARPAPPDEVRRGQQLFLEETFSDVMSVARKPRWGNWWRQVVSTLAQRDGALAELDGFLAYCRDCADPVVRQLKDLGELTDPNGFLVSRVVTGKNSVWRRLNLGRWPDFPPGTQIISKKDPRQRAA